jgi:phosphopantothenoylcysteine decarboxylase/phosphopantothenate--cysteine ligase
MNLTGKRVIVTAGGTREPIDPIRFMGNRSSGKMGFALAGAAKDRGAEVTLITTIAPPDPDYYDRVISVETVTEMRDAVNEACGSADVLIMAAAPANYTAKSIAPQKIKKEQDSLIIELVRAPDIISEISGGIIKVGFSAETENLLENAREKLRKKGMDLIVANDVTAADSGFGADTNKVYIINKTGDTEELPLMRKREVAEKILHRVEELLA